jgi:hypothetical protein
MDRERNLEKLSSTTMVEREYIRDIHFLWRKGAFYIPSQVLALQET